MTDPRALARRFPPSFLWGAATAAYQVEGAVAEDGRGPSIWDAFSHRPGRIANGDTGDTATDHYHRMADDVALMRELGLGAYRFSVAWPRVQPTGEGAPNEAGLDFYDRLVDELLGAGIRPLVTLYHWDLPQALEERIGGWRGREIVDRLGEYAGIVAARLGDRVQDWITLNEPWVFSFLGYAEGIHAPGGTDLGDGFRAAHHAHLAHRAATAAVRDAAPWARVGVTLSLQLVEPASPDPEDVAAAERVDAATNRWFLDPAFGRPYPLEVPGLAELVPDDLDLDEVTAGDPPDLIGVNYYFRQLVAAEPRAAPLGATFVRSEAPRTAMDWEIHPDGLRQVIERVHRTYAPASIVVTENGAAFDDVVGDDGSVDDPERTAYLAAHIAAVAAARDAGAPVDGYFLWSLLDNFEWSYGYDKRFGIVRVEPGSLERTVKASGRWYRDLIGRA
ncbi:MAG TPA: GH1 family beta-glucosidase [Candidatus Limnocylindria bacterium]|nr:GH1 family beta-glucosidase [Candidatus Limnocylindria bacterium]